MKAQIVITVDVTDFIQDEELSQEEAKEKITDMIDDFVSEELGGVDSVTTTISE